MYKFKVHQKKNSGRTTQYMSENFADLANLANNKLLDQGSSKKRRIEVLREIHADISGAIKKREQIPHDPKLQRIMKRFENVISDLENYINHM